MNFPYAYTYKCRNLINVAHSITKHYVQYCLVFDGVGKGVYTLFSCIETRIMRVSKPLPLYPTYVEIKEFNLAHYPDLKAFLESGQPWRIQHWQWGLDFLKYIGRNKSEHTFARFRTETERFLLWLFLYKDQPMDGLRKADILQYVG